MIKSFLSIIAILTAIPGLAQISFSGNTKDIITVSPQSSTGLNDIYVVYDTHGLSMSYTASTSNPVKWYQFSNMGGAYAEELQGVVRNGNIYTLKNVIGDLGYIIEEGTDRVYLWIVDYAAHYLDLQSLGIAPEQDCSMTTLTASGSGDKIIYYTINGRQMELDRQLELNYNTLIWNADNTSYEQTEQSENIPYLKASIQVPAPLCDTEFTLTGDRFLKHWGEEQQAISPSFSTQAVSAETTATQTERNNDNEQKDENSSLGGSAPAEIEFDATVTDAVVYNEWQISTDANFEDIQLRFNDTKATYTFQEDGTFYVRFIAGNADGTCDYTSDTYEVSIGESKLECPNAFSPGASEGVNDIWKVSYKSIISFECHIFNRWGVKIKSFSNPADGWDGTYNGKTVPAGVYFYVIKAVGADGKEYDLKGDINIIKYDSTHNTTTK